MFKDERKITFSLGKRDFKGKITFKLVTEEQTEYRLTEIGRREEDISGREDTIRTQDGAGHRGH